jgi:hypothetical protein
MALHPLWEDKERVKHVNQTEIESSDKVVLMKNDRIIIIWLLKDGGSNCCIDR